MKLLVLFFSMFLSANCLLGQDRSFIIEAGTNVHDVIPGKYLYQYSKFSEGQVFYRDGSVSQGKMNYTLLTDEMLFIDQKGDTLALTNEPTISYIRIAKDTFYFYDGFIMLLKRNGNISLGIRQGFRVVDERKPAAYDITSSTSSVSSLSSFNNENASYRLVVKEETIFYRYTDYCFSDKFEHFVFADKESLKDLFPSYDKQISRYLRQNKIDFGKRVDVEKIMSYVENGCQ